MGQNLLSSEGSGEGLDSEPQVAFGRALFSPPTSVGCPAIFGDINFRGHLDWGGRGCGRETIHQSKLLVLMEKWQ